ncbi:ATP-binding protein [Chromohalobacter nigrandesensis]|uniref:ATP-binding protein n=1 Tax=Chromohalobacter nigrandesensis TaxID=119863 RepID=UPI001FF4E4B7|nr:ATP-binding protein [Chromohalobacter nigrandesensis]MCK0745938.1 hypothetical protein [Chromohalobacter nigrandesensis]
MHTGTLKNALSRLINRAAAAVMDDLPTAFHLPQGSQQRSDTPLIPTKVIREAIVNALMHRNYRRHEPVQIIRYSNRIEIHNPGYSLKPEEQLGQPGSAWRNPTLAAVLHETRYAETKGSGIRVMRRHMEQAGLTPPFFESQRHEDRFMTTLLFVHFLDEEALEWLTHFRHLQLTEEECHALLLVRETGRITNADYRAQSRVDTLTASQHLVRLRDFGLLTQIPRGSATYYVPGERFPNETSLTDDLFSLSPESGGLSPESSGLSPESGDLYPESGGGSITLRTELLAELPGPLAQQLSELGQRTRDTSRIRNMLVSLCALRPYRVSELALLLQRNPEYLQKQYLNSLRREGLLTYLYLDDPNHPDQAYISTHAQGRQDDYTSPDP